MKVALAVVSLLFVAASSRAADPVYLDELMETPLATLQTQFPGLKKEGCYRIGEGRFLLIDVDAKKVHKPWRVAVTSVEPCRHAQDVGAMDVHDRGGVQPGDSSLDVIHHMGRPDASAPPEKGLEKIGDTELIFICKETAGCSRHTSVFLQGGMVTAVAEWYSE
jgi:hypothetical protein